MWKGKEQKVPVCIRDLFYEVPLLDQKVPVTHGNHTKEAIDNTIFHVHNVNLYDSVSQNIPTCEK